MARLFVEQLTVLDCAFLDAQRGLVGESWIVDLELEGELDDQGMVLDFGSVKKDLKRAIDALADHTLVVPRLSPALGLSLSGDRTGLSFRAETGAIEHQAPRAALCLVDTAAITTETLAAHINAQLATSLPGTVSRATVSLRHEKIDGAWYRYTHGLKKHAGQCQRIAHGHRSRIEIRVDGIRDERLERTWAERWRDIYLGSASDIVAHGKGRIRFEYRSGEGEFALELPVERVDLLKTDSTVELIAAHLAAEVAAERRGRIEIRAYEGVMKGAIATH